MGRLWSFLRQKRNREVLGWIGGGVVVVAAGMWTLFTYLVPHDDKKPGAPTVTVVNPSGPVIAPGRDATFNAPVNFGLNEKQVGDKIDEVKALVQQLAANRSGPGTPDQAQAIAEAVSAARTSLGDSRTVT